MEAWGDNTANPIVIVDHHTDAGDGNPNIRGRVTPQARLVKDAYLVQEGLRVLGSHLHCGPCGAPLNHLDLDSIKKHCATKKHATAKRAEERLGRQV